MKDEKLFKPMNALVRFNVEKGTVYVRFHYKRRRTRDKILKWKVTEVKNRTAKIEVP